VNFVGQPIAAVAAADRRNARAALAAIKVDYETLPSVVGPGAARQAGAPILFPRGKGQKYNAGEGAGAPASWSGNVRGPTSAFSRKKKAARRSIDKARADHDPLLFEGTFRTAVQQHACLEPHAAVARFDGDALTVHISTQQVAELRSRIAKQFKLDPAKVRVIAEHIGGGFGSKATLADETISAIKLAQAAKAPVRVAFDRHEELSVAGYRPATEVKIALLPGRDGALKALSVIAHSDAGVAANSIVAGLARLIYPAEAKELVDHDVVSNLPPGCPFRGPGGPPMAFALEQAIDEAALRLKADPIHLRKRWDPNPDRQRLYDWAAGLETWRRRPGPEAQTGRYRRGVGVAAGYWLYLWQLGTKVALAIEDGRLVASVATQDIGTGTRSVIADTVAREFELEPHEVEVRIGDSKLPNGPGSGGSRVTASIVPPLLLAAEKLKSGVAEKTLRKPAPGSNAPWRDLIAASPDFKVEAERAEDNPRTAYGNNSLLKDAGMIGWIFGFMMRRSSHIAIGAGAPSSVQVVEVEVDTLLGHVRVLRAHSGIAVGKLAAPTLARSQAAGAIIQGLGYALYEGREVDSETGDVLTTSLDDYRMPGIADIPPIDLYFDEGGFDHVRGRSVGIGEVATVPISAAIANAIHNAIGARPYEIPLRPDRLLGLIEHRRAA
jgi:xanthine dehydrogenase YagR molybdenum-binding subunit